MKKYWLYLIYILEHKKNVFLECRKIKEMWWHGITHDLSKFYPSEFIPYANWFYGTHGCKFNGGMKWEFDEFIKCEKQFNGAWKLHYKRNKHHWNYWVGRDMPEVYIKQMICDWAAMSRKFGDTPQEFYMKNYDKIQITHTSRVLLEFNLGLIDSVCLVSNVGWKDYCEMTNKTIEEDYMKIGDRLV